MRTLHGSMMDTAGTRPDDLPRAQLRWLQATLPDEAHPQRAPLPLLPAARAMKLQGLLGQLALNQGTQAARAALLVPALAFDAQALAEAQATGAALAQALWQQGQSLQAQWLEGLAELGEEMAELRHANTVSKLVDQEMNLVQRTLALVAAQATATVRLAETLQVNLGWWMEQRLNPAD